MRRNLISLAACGVLALSTVPAAAQSVENAPPPAPYKKVSDLVKLPDFLPGIGCWTLSQVVALLLDIAPDQSPST
jgi:hypothetical protein